MYYVCTTLQSSASHLWSENYLNNIDVPLPSFTSKVHSLASLKTP